MGSNLNLSTAATFSEPVRKRTATREALILREITYRNATARRNRRIIHGATIVLILAIAAVSLVAFHGQVLSPIMSEVVTLRGGF